MRMNQRFRRITPRVAIGLAVVAGLTVFTGAAEPAGQAAPTGTKILPPDVLPYSRTTAFRVPLAASARIDPRSDAIVARLASNVAGAKAMLATGHDVPTVYRVTGRDPFLRVWVGGRLIRFRVPRHAVTGDGADNPLVLLDRNHPDFGPYVELRLYQAYIDHDNGEVYSEGSGLFRYGRSGNGRPFLGHGTGSGLSIMAGLVRPREVANGAIQHAVRFSYSNVDFLSGRYREPAIKTDQPSGGYTRDPAGAMEMGMRLQLSPTVRCDNRTVPGHPDTSRETRFLRILCRALQRYGMIVVDGTGAGGLMLQMENEATAPWSSIIGSTNNGNYGYIIRDRTTPGDGLDRDVRSGIPWNQMRVIAG